MNDDAFQDHYPDQLAHCYGCGRLNPHGHRLRSCWDGDEAVARTVAGMKAISENMENTARVITGLGKRSDEIGRILEVIEGVKVHDQGKEKCGIVSFSKAGTDAVRLRRQLHNAGINTSVIVPGGRSSLVTPRLSS